MLIEASKLRKDYGGTVVLDGVDFSIAEGEKVALVGRNGCGKTTLLNILCASDDDFSGSCRRAPGKRIALVPQLFPEFAGTALEYIASEALELRGRLGKLEEAMTVPEKVERVMAEYGVLRERYDLMDGDGAEERGARFLESIGLPDVAERQVSVLSGGEKNVLAFARALNSKPDLLVLDEPGNHLDLWGLAWLENFLAGIPQAVLIVSHNRYLLDRVVSRTVELENGRAVSYAGGWSAFRMEKLRSNAAKGMEWKADQKKLARLEALVKRFEQIARAHPDPAWGKRLHSRRSQLERARNDAVDKPIEDQRRIQADFRAETSKADIAVAVEGYTRVLPDGRCLFSDADLLVRSGERVAIVGPNGSGKTTFLTELVGTGSWDQQVLRIGPSFTLGWCPQNQEILNREKTVREEFLDLGAFTEEDIFGVLRRFIFSRNDLDKRIGSLSGGERNRLQLARAVMLKADLLILDEPTNHLDIPAREAVEEALIDFRGTLIVVSHDRFFLDEVVDRVVEIDDEFGFTSWDGNFSEFWYRAYGNQGARLHRNGKVAGSGASGIEVRGKAIVRGRNGGIKDKTSGRKGSQPADAGAAMEGRILGLENERTALEHKAAQAFSKGDFKEARRLGNDLAELTGRIEKLYREWQD